MLVLLLWPTASAQTAPSKIKSYAWDSALVKYQPIPTIDARTHNQKLRDALPAHSFPRGWCTAGTANLIEVTWQGNARNWLANAKRQGYETSKEPEVNAILVENLSRWGHVSLVVSIQEKTFTVKEMNYRAFGRYNFRTISKQNKNIIGFINN